MDGLTVARPLDSRPAADALPAGERGLLAAYRAGDRAAAERLVETTYRRVYAALVRLSGGDADLAADLTQETYRRAWQALPSFEGRSRVSTWLYRIAYTTYLNHVRGPAKVVPLDRHLAPEPAAADPSPEERLERSAAAARLRQAVLGLAEDLRFTLTARYWGELPVRDIARQQGVTGAAIRKRLKKALRILAESIPEDGP